MACSTFVNGQPIHGRFTNNAGPDYSCHHCEFGDSREAVYTRAAESWFDKAIKEANTANVIRKAAIEGGYRRAFKFARTHQRLARTYARWGQEVLDELTALNAA